MSALRVIVQESCSPIHIKARFMGRFRSITGMRSQDVTLRSGAKALDLIQLLSKDFGERFSSRFLDPVGIPLDQPAAIMVNHRVTRSLDTSLKDGTEVIFLQTVSGG